MSAPEFVEELKRQGKRVPGIGHRIKSKDNRDKRVELLQNYAKKVGGMGEEEGVLKGLCYWGGGCGAVFVRATATERETSRRHTDNTHKQPRHANTNTSHHNTTTTPRHQSQHTTHHTTTHHNTPHHNTPQHIKPQFFPGTRHLQYAVSVEEYTLGKAANLVLNVRTGIRGDGDGDGDDEEGMRRG